MYGEKCKGGFVTEALEFGRFSNLAREEYYPYQERNGMCRQRGLDILPDKDRHWKARFMPFLQNKGKLVSVTDDLEEFRT